MNYLQHAKRVIGGITIAAMLFSCEKTFDNEVVAVWDQELAIAGNALTFSNLTQGAESFEWKVMQGETVLHESTEKDLTYTFKYPGAYKVMLTPNGAESAMITREVSISEALPEISLDKEAITGEEITLSYSVYDPDNKGVSEISWEFVAEGSDAADVVTGAEISANAASVAAPVAQFINDGELTLKLAVTMADANLSEGGDGMLKTEEIITVKAELAPTLYIAQKDGTLLKGKINVLGPKVSDMAIDLAGHPLTLRYAENKLYIFNAGSDVVWGTFAQEIPGSIMSVDANDQVMVHAKFLTDTEAENTDHYSDPFAGDIANGKIYFTDRNAGVYQIPASSENLEIAPAGLADLKLVANNELAYYSSYGLNVDGGGYGYGWGALNGDFRVVDGEYWWSKASNHRGLWRFEDGDIGVTTALPAAGGLLQGHTVKAFAVDKVNGKVYFSTNKANDAASVKFYRANLDGSDEELIDDAPFDAEGGTNEAIGITGIAVDPNSGYVYWAYRAAAVAEGEEAIPSGIKRFKLDGELGKDEVEMYIEGIEAYGIAIDAEKK
ncbi:hypothetical protein [Algivirga pacifica]|uniref:PKD domain-containing protein n=1 Tax=Algivirga pacifica TaxID=1162670 RepID=A0ABP9DDN0_9BACT